MSNQTARHPKQSSTEGGHPTHTDPDPDPCLKDVVANKTPSVLQDLASRGTNTDLFVDKGHAKPPSSHKESGVGKAENDPSRECRGILKENGQKTIGNKGSGDFASMTSKLESDRNLSVERKSDLTSSSKSLETAESVIGKNGEDSPGPTRTQGPEPSTSTLPQAKQNSELKLSLEKLSPLKTKPLKKPFLLIDPLRLRPGDPEGINFRYLDENNLADGDKQNDAKNQPQLGALEEPVKQSDLEVMDEEPGRAVTQADLEAPVTEDPIPGPRRSLRTRRPVLPPATEFVGGHAEPSQSLKTTSENRSVRKTKTWKALKGWETFAALAESSDLDRYHSDDLDLIYGVVEFSGNLGLAATDFIVGRSFVDLGDYSVAKIISGIQYVQDTVTCSKPYEWLMQGGAAILKVTRLGRCLVTMTSWGSEAVGKVLSGVRWTYVILGLSAVGREGQRESLWEQGAIKLSIRMWAFPLWALVSLMNTALCAVHSSLLYVRDDSLTHIRQARARRDAGTKPAPTNKARALLWQGAIRLSKHRPSVVLHPWEEDSGNGAGGGGRGGRGGGGRREGRGDGDTAAGGKRGGKARKHGGDGDGGDGCGGGGGYGGGDYGGNEERYCNTGQDKLNRGGGKEREDRTDKDSHHPDNEPNERQNQDSSDNQRARNGREQHEKLRREEDTPKSSSSGSEKENGFEENHRHHHHDEITDGESFASHEDFENRPGETSESSECSYIVGGYQTPTLVRSPFAERQVHVVKMPQHKPPSSSTRRETSKNTSSESSEVASQPEDIEESSDKATTRGEDSNRTPSSCKILKAAVTPCVWSPQEASSSTPHHPNASKPLPPCFGDSVISVLNGLSVCVRNEVREVKVKELRVNGEGVRVRVMPVGWSRCGSPRVRLSSLDRKGGVSARKVSDGGQLAARRKITPIKRRLSGREYGASPTPFRFILPPTAPYTLGFGDLTVGKQFLCLLRKFPYLSDIIRDPRDPPAVSFLLDTPVLITDDKTRRLLDWTLASKSMSGCVKRTLDDLYSEDSYDSEQDPDYQPSESLDTTDPLEYSEQDAAEEEESSDEVFSFKPSRQKTTEVAAETHRGEEHSIVLSPDHYDDTPTTSREPQSKRHVRKLGRLVLAPKRPELNPKLHDNEPSRVDTDAGPKKNHFVFSERVGMTSKQQQDKGELGLTGHGLTPRRQGVMRKDERDGEKKSAEKVEGVCCSSENGGGDGEELKPEGSDSDKENSPSHRLGLDKNLGRKHVVNFHDYDRSDDYDSHSD